MFTGIRFAKFSNYRKCRKSLSDYPSPKPTLTLTCHLGQNVDLGDGGVGGQLHRNVKLTLGGINLFSPRLQYSEFRSLTFKSA